MEELKVGESYQLARDWSGDIVHVTVTRFVVAWNGDTCALANVTGDQSLLVNATTSERRDIPQVLLLPRTVGESVANFRRFPLYVNLYDASNVPPTVEVVQLDDVDAIDRAWLSPL